MNQSSAVLNVVKGIAFAAGLFIAGGGLLGGVVYSLQRFLSAEAVPLDSAVVAASTVALGVGLGGALAWQGNKALRGQPSAFFRPPSVWLLILLYIPIVIIGQLLITFDLFPAFTFPLFHLAAAVLPPFAILAFAGRALKALGLRWRELIMQLSGGAFLATAFAFLAEIILGMLLLFITFFITALMPGGIARIEELAANFQDPTWLQNPANVQEIILMPPVLISLVLVFVLLAPMVEELVKLLGVTLMSYRRPLRAQVFMWGLASGAGFALVENFFNTVLALDMWAFVILLRIGGTAMHCMGTGLTALGWHALQTERRPWTLIGAYAVSVTIHALWNGAVIGMAGSSVFVVGNSSPVMLALVGMIILFMLALLILLTFGLIIALVVLTNRLRAEFTPTTPPASELHTAQA